MSEVILNSTNFRQEVLESDIPVLVDFWAPWCGPCKMLAPIVAQLATKYDGKVKVGKVDVDENPEVAEAFNISSIPTLIMFKDGNKFISVIIKKFFDRHIITHGTSGFALCKSQKII